MSIFASLNQFSKGRLSWLLLLVAIIFLKPVPIFQHVMMLAPCVMCIYERVAMMGIGFAAMIGLIAPNNPLVRWIALAAWGASAYKGLMLAMQHVDYQFNPSPFATCDLFVTFPSWAPLNNGFLGCLKHTVTARRLCGSSLVFLCLNGLSSFLRVT